MTMIPESAIQAKFYADKGKKRGEILANIFADFYPSISRKSGRKKFHKKNLHIFHEGRNIILSQRLEVAQVLANR